MFEENVVVEVPEEERRRIEISLFDEEGGVVFEAGGTVSRRTAHRFMEGVGYAFVPQEPAQGPRLPSGYPIAVGRISCEHDRARTCTDYPTKCPECEGNKAKSYFKPKEE